MKITNNKVTVETLAGAGYRLVQADSNGLLSATLSVAGGTGPAGPQGATGPAGSNGSNGATGSTGPQGIQGITGATGATGPAGSNGSAGSSGLTYSAVVGNTNWATKWTGTQSLGTYSLLERGGSASMYEVTTFQMAAQHGPVIATVAGTYSLDLSQTNIWNLTMTGDLGLTTLNEKYTAGIIFLKQDSIGGHGLNLAVGKWKGAIQLGIGTYSFSETMLHFVYDGSQCVITAQAYILTQSGTQSGASSSNFIGPAGPQGTTGNTGATGPTGPQGIQGPTGSAGTNGTNGATGPTGSAGTNGVNGGTLAGGLTDYGMKWIAATQTGTASFKDIDNQILLPDGTQGLPSISFISATNTGIYKDIYGISLVNPNGLWRFASSFFVPVNIESSVISSLYGPYPAYTCGTDNTTGFGGDTGVSQIWVSGITNSQYKVGVINHYDLNGINISHTFSSANTIPDTIIYGGLTASGHIQGASVSATNLSQHRLSGVYVDSSGQLLTNQLLIPTTAPFSTTQSTSRVVPGLSFSALPSAQYSFEFGISFTQTLATSSIALGLSYSNGGTMSSLCSMANGVAGPTFGYINTNGGTIVGQGVTTGKTIYFATIKGAYQQGLTAGNVQILIQSVKGGTVSIVEPSYGEINRTN